jgi:hypothetical protein
MAHYNDTDIISWLTKNFEKDESKPKHGKEGQEQLQETDKTREESNEPKD